MIDTKTPPYYALSATVRDSDGATVAIVRLTDDMPGCIDIVEVDDATGAELTTVLVAPEHVPALIQALRVIARDNRRVEREAS